MRVKDYLYTNSEMENIINEYIHSFRDRLVLKLVFIDNISYEKIAENQEVDLTPRQVANIVKKGSVIIENILKKRNLQK